MTGTLYQWFEAGAARHPDRPALEVGGEVFSYAALQRMAVALAARVVAEHGGRPNRVALVAARTVDAYVGYLAIQRLGSTVVPLNPDHPRPRSLEIAMRARVAVALTERAYAGMFDALPRRVRPTVLDPAAARGAAPAAERLLPAVPTDLDRDAYILFTSGSTGQPKGVPITQRALDVYLAHNIARYQVGPDCRLSQVFGLTFDASVFDMFVTWGAGATLVVPAREDLYRPVDFIVRHQLTHWFSVPSVIAVAERLGSLPRGRATTVRHSLFGAEPVTVEHARLWRAVAPNTRIYNLYGPTEVTITCTDHQFTGDIARWQVGANGTLTIGAPYPHVELAVLDDVGRPADEGELCIRGLQRFHGYLDPHDNAGRFVDITDDGAVGYDGTGDLAPLCRRHHLLKHTPRWQLDQPKPGLIIWTTPGGRRIRVDNRPR